MKLFFNEKSFFYASFFKKKGIINESSEIFVSAFDIDSFLLRVIKLREKKIL